MIIVRTDKTPAYKIGNSKKNYYTCPACNAEIAFGSYIRTMCDKCSGSLNNVEKLLDDLLDIGKINYYTNGKV